MLLILRWQEALFFRIPERLLGINGEYVGVEFGQLRKFRAFRRVVVTALGVLAHLLEA